MQENELPHKKIVFVCTNERAEGERVCCASSRGAEIHTRLKELIRERGYRTKIRVSKSGCMDRCEMGANVMVFPDNRWLTQIEESDLEPLVDGLIADIENGDS
jgi:(2Fe-2S) ferredoxin